MVRYASTTASGDLLRTRKQIGGILGRGEGQVQMHGMFSRPGRAFPRLRRLSNFQARSEENQACGGNKLAERDRGMSSNLHRDVGEQSTVVVGCGDVNQTVVASRMTTPQNLMRS